jgi:hypothetical protein
MIQKKRFKVSYHFIKRTYYSSEYLYITRFVNLRTNFEQNHLHKFDAVKEELTKLLATDESRSLKFISDKLLVFICLSTTDDDIDLIIKLINLIKRYLFAYFLITFIY